MHLKFIKDVSDTQKTLIITHNGEAKVVLQDVKLYEKTLESIALLNILSLGNKNLKRSKFKSLQYAVKNINKKKDLKHLKSEYNVNIISDAEEDMLEIYKL